jgi:ABC-2 type transport system permease protein
MMRRIVLLRASFVHLHTAHRIVPDAPVRTLALTWVAVIPGLSAKSADGAIAFSYPLIFLPFISSAFVPTDTMPGPVRAFAEYQPVTAIVNAIRDLFTQQPVGTDIWIALAWCVGILIVAYIFAMLTYRRRIS